MRRIPSSPDHQGKARITIEDGDRRVLTVLDTEVIGVGGKDQARASIRNFSTRATLPADIARDARFVFTEATCMGPVNRVLNIRMSTVQDAFKRFHAATGGQ